MHQSSSTTRRSRNRSTGIGENDPALGLRALLGISFGYGTLTATHVFGPSALESSSGTLELLRRSRRSEPGPAASSRGERVRPFPPETRRSRLLELSGKRLLTSALRCSPYGIRTRAATLRGWCPRPLDERAVLHNHGGCGQRRYRARRAFAHGARRPASRRAHDRRGAVDGNGRPGWTSISSGGR